MASDACEVITEETASLFWGIREGDEEYKDPFNGLDEDKEELEDNETVMDNC